MGIPASPSKVSLSLPLPLPSSLPPPLSLSLLGREEGTSFGLEVARRRKRGRERGVRGGAR